LFNAAKGGVRMREGWEYKTIEKCTSIEYGTRVVQKRDGGTIYPVYGGGGETFRMDRYNREDCLIIARFAMSPRCVRYVAGKFFLNDSGLSVKSKEELEQAYLNYHLLFFNDVIYHLGKGAAQRNLDVKAFRQLVIAIPPKSTQLSIVSELDKLNELIRIKKEQLKDYDALAQSIFYEMFGDPVENEKGWEVKKLGELCSKIGSGATPRGGNESYKDEGISLIRSLNVYNNEFRRKDLAYIDDEQAAALSNVTLLENDVLLNITGASVARCCIVPSDLLPARVNQHVCIIRPLDNVLVTIFLNKVLTNISYQIRLLALARSKGATREALPKSVVDSLLVPLPPLPLQHFFAQKIEQIEQQKAAIQKTITDLESLLAARMQYWFD